MDEPTRDLPTQEPTRDLPSGTVTFLFTDIEDSTNLLRELGTERYSATLAEHRRVLRDAIAGHAGVEVDTQGDAFFIAFGDADAAVAAAAQAQENLAPGPVKVRMGLHTGTPLVGPEGYVGEDVHLGARIAAAGHGGQILISKQTRDGTTWAQDHGNLLDLGEHRVKGFAEPVWIFQVGTEKHPPLRTISNTNLPRPPSTFVGRRLEVEQLSGVIRDGARLVTLTGPGGTGKTRLAIEAATSLVPDFKNGVFWVGLAAVSDSALVMQTVGQVLGAKGDLAEYIADRQMLLVLDNFEHVVDAAPEISRLLARCRALQILVTSRELLRVSGEGDYAVPVLADAEALDLFCERSGLPAAATISDLCGRLDNLPLAIELAAARTKVMSPAQILDRLSHRLDMLKGGRDADARQQTLRATILWSYELLNAAEQRLFSRMAVFRGGCTIEAAEGVADADVDLLQSLVEKSLVRHVGDRFRMLETIREFAAERLADSGEGDQLAQRHAEFFVAFVEAAGEQLTGPDQSTWWQRLTDEIENIRAALAWSSAGARPNIALRLSARMWRYWWQRGHYAEGRKWYTAALAAGSQEPEMLRADALSGLGSMEMGSGDTTKAIQIFETCLDIFQRHGDYAQTVRTFTDLGIALTDEGKLDLARESFERALVLTRGADDVRRTAVNLINLGDLALVERDLERAADLFEQAFHAMVDVGDAQSAGNAMGNWGQVEFLRGNLDVAARLLSDALSRLRETDDRYSILHSMITVGALFLARGDTARAGIVLGRVDGLQREMDIAINPSELRLLDETLATMRATIPAGELEPLLAEGRALDHDAALDMIIAALEG
jgi:predicted ATPase/class 3 adenylate cyclase